MEYDGLSMSSGGLKGIAILGALSYLDLQGCLSKVRYYSGCSIGSILSVLLAVGWRPIELYRRVKSITIFNGFGSLNVQDLKDKHGLMNNDIMRKELEQLVIEKRQELGYPKEKWLPTFLDLHQEGVYVAVTIVDRRTRRGHRIDYESHPACLATDGALMSSNVPLIFHPIHFDGMEVVDGALVDPFPVDYLDRINRKNRRKGISKRLKILGVVIYGAPDDKSTSIMNYISDMVSITMEQLQRQSIKNASRYVDILEMSVKDMSLLSFGDGNARNEMYFAGFEDGRLLHDALSNNGNSATKNKKKSPKLPKAAMKTPVTIFPKDALLKCLMCQPVDILCQAALTGAKSLQSCIDQLSPDRRFRLENLARQIIQKEVSSGTYVKTEAPPDTTYANGEKVKIRENYSQKLYDQLPIQFKAAAKVMVDSLPPEKAQSTINGINIVMEGLRHLGIDVFSGFLLAGQSSNGGESNSNNPPNSPREEIHDRVEIMAEEGLSRRKIEEVD